MGNEDKGNALAELFGSIPLLSKLMVNTAGLKKDGLTRSQLYILLTLARQPHMTMSQIAAALTVSKEQATRAVAPLADAGLVERESVESNRKLVLVTLTASGQELVERKKAHIKENLYRYYADMDDAAADQLVQAISVVLNTLREMDSKLSSGRPENSK